MSARETAGATGTPSPARPGALSVTVRTWHRILSHGEPPQEAAWERDAWDEHVTALREEHGAGRAVAEIARSSAEHMRHRMREGAPTAIPAGVFLLVGFLFTIADQGDLSPLDQSLVAGSMFWAAVMFLVWPSRFRRFAIVINGVLWAAAMARRFDLDAALYDSGNFTLHAGHLCILAGAVLMVGLALLRPTDGSATLAPAWMLFALGATLVALANMSWSQVTKEFARLLEMLGFGGVSLLLGYTLFRIRKLPLVD